MNNYKLIKIIEKKTANRTPVFLFMSSKIYKCIDERKKIIEKNCKKLFAYFSKNGNVRERTTSLYLW